MEHELILTLLLDGVVSQLIIYGFDSMTDCMAYGSYIEPMDIITQWECKAKGWSRV